MEESEHGFHNFTNPSSHRLPTISGTQAIRDAVKNSKPISTSLASLDVILRSSRNASTQHGGLPRGVVTELYGPPGVGKTALALQLAVNAMQSSDSASNVTWIDTSSPLMLQRLSQILHRQALSKNDELPSSPPAPDQSLTQILDEKFNHMRITSLPHLLALFVHSMPNFPPANTGLIVLDDLSNFLLSALPRGPATSSSSQRTSSAVRNDVAAKRVSARRFQVLSSFALSLQKFAATHSVPIVVVSKVTHWDNCLSGRIALFRDFWPDVGPIDDGFEREDPSVRTTQFERRTLRYAKVVRLGGKMVHSAGVGFVIEKGGLREVGGSTDQNDTSVMSMATQAVPDFEELENGFTGGAEPKDSEDENHVGTTPDHHQNEASTPVPGHKPQKRKARDIARSEGDIGSTIDGETTLPPRLTHENSGFQSASSQLEHGLRSAGPSNSVEKTKKIRINDARDMEESNSSTNDEKENSEEEEMLLDRYEQVPSFSQAAADMSEPLTPSDDSRASP